MALNRLSAVQVRKLATPGRHADGGNLYLNISKTGARSWVFFYRRDGRVRELGLGSAKDVTLGVARDRALACRVALSNGTDPKAWRARSASKSFGECAKDLIASLRPSWRSQKHALAWDHTFAHPAAGLMALPVADVATEDVLKILKPIWLQTPETASRIRNRIEMVLNAAGSHGLRSGENPARWKGHLENLLPRMSRSKRTHFEALQIDRVPDLMRRLLQDDGIASPALRFTILTAARSNEAMRAKWSEFDLASRTWMVPAERMKAEREHRVPLSDPVVAIIERQRALRVDDWLFPGRRHGASLSNTALSQVMDRLGETATVHGFRSTFRDWASERTNFPREVCEMALAHTIGDATEAAYRRGDLFEKRRKLMKAWAEFCLGTEA